MVICTENVDCTVEASCNQFIIVVGDILNNISRDAVGADNDKVFVCAKLLCLKPESTFFFIGVAAVLQLLNDLLNAAVCMEPALREPCVITDPVLCEVVLQSLNILGESEFNKCLSALLIGK